MNKPVKRDPDTGQIRTKGRVGAALDWIRWAGGVIIIPTLLAAGGWGLKVERFMAAGGRCTSVECEEIRLQHAKDIAALQLERERALNDLLDRLPPRHYVEAQEAKYSELLRRLNRIERLLER